MQVSQGSGVCAVCVFGGLCVDMWQLVHQWSFFAVWLSFDCFWRMVHCTNRQKHSKPFVSNRHRSTETVQTVYQRCTNRQKTVKKSQNTVKTAQKWPLVYQSSHVYQDCTNRIPPVYQKRQKTDKTAKMTIGVPIVTGLPRLYQQCNNSLPIVNNNLAIANRSRVSCAHNTSRAVIGLNITPWPWNLGHSTSLETEPLDRS